MRIACCNCKKDLGQKEPLDDPSVSHTLCETCLDESYRENGITREDAK